MKLALALVALLLGSLAPPAAHALPYTVTACGPSATDWAAANTAPAVLAATVSCPSAPGETFGGYVVGARIAAPNTAPGEWASWSLTAPPATRISHLALQRYMGTSAEGWKSIIVTAENRELERCERPWWLTTCEHGGPGGPGAINEVVFPGLGTPSISFRVECARTVPCANGNTVRTAWIAVYRATITVDDPAPPTVSPLSGTITGPGWHRGTDTASFSASDASGVKQLRLMAGAQELARQDQACDYGRMQPCPAQASAAMSIPMAQVPDGTHELRAVAVDAAAQEGAVVGTLRVDRTAPTPPTDVQAERAHDGTYTLAWTNPAQGTAAPIVAAHLAVCDTLGKDCKAAGESRGTGVERATGVSLPGPEGPRTLRVWLEDEAGNVDSISSAALPLDTSARAMPKTVRTNPPALSPSGPEPSPRLRVTRARRSGSTLTISGTIARAASAWIEAQVSRKTTGKPVLAKARVKPKRGKWTVRVKLPRALRDSRAMYLAVRYAGQSGYRATTLRRRLTERPARAGRATDEFNIAARGNAR